MFDCTPFLPKCKAACCGVVPIEKALFEKHKDKIKIDYEIHEFEGVNPVTKKNEKLVMLLTENASCPFLDKDLKCTIHDDKPYVCSHFGSEEHEHLTCPWQDKDGNIRCRSERRRIDKKVDKDVKKFLNNGKA